MTIKSGVYLWEGMVVEDDVFLGPQATFTNDRYPRSRAEWTCEGIVIRRGASVGAGAVVLPGVTIGERAMVGAGAVVTKDVEPGAVVVGNPARVVSRLRGGGAMTAPRVSVVVPIYNQAAVHTGDDRERARSGPTRISSWS